NYTLASQASTSTVDESRLTLIAQQLEAVRRIIADVASPRLSDLLNDSGNNNPKVFDDQAWTAMCQQACSQALEQLQVARLREGQRLAATMLECSVAMGVIVDQVETQLPLL